MKFIDLSIDVPESEFPNVCKSPQLVQLMMDKAKTLQAGYLRDVYDHMEDQLKNKETYVELVDKLAYYEDSIPILESNLEQATNQQHINEIKDNLATAIRSRDRIQKRIKGRDEMDLIMDRMLHQKKRMFAAGLDEWVDKLGKWFATGAVGPGTVTFKDKTYTAE
jgi:hypothetical protein